MKSNMNNKENNSNMVTNIVNMIKKHGQEHG